jgi:hypothetical protein
LFIWIFQKALAQRLALWAWASIMLGALCFLSDSDFWAGLAFQFFGWALVELGIAGFGYLSLRRRQAGLSVAEKISAAPEETGRMSFLLRGGTALSLVFSLGGLALFFFTQAHGGFLEGAGMGIFLQGAFMFFFNRYHVRKLR